MAIESFLFDIDEVVVSSTPLQLQAEQVTAREMAQKYRPAPEYAGLRNGGEEQIDWTQFKGMARVSIAAEIWGIESGSELADEYRLSVVRSTVAIAGSDNVPFVAGAEEGLARLQELGLPMAAVTSSHRDIYSAYDRVLDLGRFFEESVTHGEAEHNKPEPHPYLLAAERVGAEAANSVVVEDSGSGIRSGLAAGAIVLGIATTTTTERLQGLGVHHTTENWQELTEQIDRLTRV